MGQESRSKNSTRKPPLISGHTISGKRFTRGTLTKDRIAPFETPAFYFIGDDRLLVQVVKNKVGQIVSMKLDGTDTREFTKPGEGLPYGLT